MHPVLAQWQKKRLVAVIRAQSQQEALCFAQKARQAGIHWLEITLTFPDAPRVIRQLAPGVGAGTVLTTLGAEAALAHGAEFLVSPCTIPSIIALGQKHGTLVVSGAWTPTEVLTAWQLGADAIKLFPAHLGGVEYLRSLRQVFPEISFFPCGGITLATAPAYLGAGAIAVGVGSGLLGVDNLVEQVNGLSL